MEKVHAYGAKAAPRRDPRLAADPSAYINMGYDGGGYAGGAARPGTLHPGVRAHATYLPSTHREQYCVCAKTDSERRLLIAVIVLACICVLLLASLASVVPLMIGDATCEGSDCGKNNEFWPIMRSRLENMF